MTRLLAANATAEAADLLRAGELVALPTETVYGLGADATNDRAVAAIFSAKGRPRFNPLILHVSDTAGAEALALWNDRAAQLAERFWPGPLTLVLPRKGGAAASLLASAGLDTVALRRPAHPVAQALLEQLGRPIAAPSANRSGAVSPTSAEDVRSELGDRVAAILDGSPCTVGVESTIVDASGPQLTLLRPGGLPIELIEDVVGPLARVDGGAIRAPGMMTSHYAPAIPVRLHAAQVHAGEGLLTFGPHWPDGAAALIHLSQSGNLEEAAARLFAALRALDRPEIAGIAVMPIPEHGLGLAINDRLRRAAAPRPR